MIQHLLSENAAEMVTAIRSDPAAFKSQICDALTNAVFLCPRGEEAWQILTTLSEYAHLINALTMTDGKLKEKGV